MKKLKNFATKLWNDESGQGTAEYVLLIAIVVGLVVMFREKITKAVTGQVDKVSGQIQGFGE